MSRVPQISDRIASVSDLLLSNRSLEQTGEALRNSTPSRPPSLFDSQIQQNEVGVVCNPIQSLIPLDFSLNLKKHNGLGEDPDMAVMPDLEDVLDSDSDDSDTGSQCMRFCFELVSFSNSDIAVVDRDRLPSVFESGTHSVSDPAGSQASNGGGSSTIETAYGLYGSMHNTRIEKLWKKHGCKSGPGVTDSSMF